MGFAITPEGLSSTEILTLIGLVFLLVEVWGGGGGGGIRPPITFCGPIETKFCTGISNQSVDQLRYEKN